MLTKKVCFASLASLLACTGMAEELNMTDLAVANDKSADAPVKVTKGPTIPKGAFLHPSRIRYDADCFRLENRDTFILSGAFHYFRTPEALWGDRLDKIKALGFNCVETYVPWNWHEQVRPDSTDDFSKLELDSLARFLALAEARGLYVILRPGPYICAEWSGGGFPRWLLREKPSALKGKAWLQGTDPEFLKWNDHWIRAVCRVAKAHQLTNREPGTGGIILFQLENEFNRIKWFPRAEKKAYLEHLATVVREEGIDVPLVTCWTEEARNVTEGPLAGVLDMVNSYPRWAIEKNFGRLINQQLKTQPGRPLLSGELQGGWMSTVGGRLAQNQDGLTPAQTQNLALYALQRGFSGINFYMLVGGTHFDDWNARNMTTTYDYAAAIGETGETGETTERYERLKGVAAFAMEHGARVARGALDERAAIVCEDPAVRVAVRRTTNGDRYVFIRTEDHKAPHAGSFTLDGASIAYDLEPFGSRVLYLAKDQTEGRWYPEKHDTPTAEPRAAERTPITFAEVEPVAATPPWVNLAADETVEDQGIFTDHFILYRASVPAGSRLTIGRPGKKVLNGTPADEVVASVDGKLLKPESEDEAEVAYRMPGEAGAPSAVTFLYESRGLHHHTTAKIEDFWTTAPHFVRVDGKPIPHQFAHFAKATALALSRGEKGIVVPTEVEPLLTFFTAKVQAPARKDNVKLKLEQMGNGYLYINGNCLGRVWEQGPQREYYVPSCWLNDTGDNTLVLTLRPTAKGAQVKSAELVVR